jgi:hypothetical protein
VTGANLPITATLSIAGAACGATSNATISGFMAVCTAASTGSKTATVKTNTDVLGGTVIDATRLINVRGLNPLNDTGITSSQCFAAGGTSFYSCSSVAALALSSAQDGMVGRDVTAPDGTDGVLGFSFSLVPKTGGGTYDKTECVKDNVTGLMWEGKTTGGARTFGLLYTNYHTQTGNTSQNTDWP